MIVGCCHLDSLIPVLLHISGTCSSAHRQDFLVTDTMFKVMVCMCNSDAAHYIRIRCRVPNQPH